MTYFLGVDVSTTATKALLMDEQGSVVAAATSPYQFSAPRPLWSEQDPHLWWKGAKSSISQALSQAGIPGSTVQAVGLTGQMHGLVLLDEAGTVLRPAILWNDQRTGAECDEIRQRLGKQRLIQITGNDALTGFTAPKILWVKNNEPELFQQVRHILLPKDYVRYCLTGEFASDRAGGSGTLLFSLKDRDWSREVTETLGIEPDWLPPTFEGVSVTGAVTAAAAEATGLAPGTPVVGGGGDQAAQAVGVGAVAPGTVALTLGTSGVVFASTDGPIVEPEGRLHAFCHALPGKWHLMGVMLSAAGSLRWYRDTVAPDVAFETLTAEAASTDPGSEGLLFLPYLTGERTPHSDPLARGAFVGLTVRHNRPHLTRAVLEGVAFGLRDSFELMKDAGLAAVDQVRLSGGGARSGVWRQILADVLQTTLVTVNTTEGAAYGAAVLAAVGTGRFSSVEAAVNALIAVTDAVEPREAVAHEYDDYYGIYRSLYPVLKESFEHIAVVESSA